MTFQERLWCNSLCRVEVLCKKRIVVSPGERLGILRIISVLKLDQFNFIRSLISLRNTKNILHYFIQFGAIKVEFPTRQPSLPSLSTILPIPSFTFALACFSSIFRRFLKQKHRIEYFSFQVLFSRFDFKLPVLWTLNFENRFDSKLGHPFYIFVRCPF